MKKKGRQAGIVGASLDFTSGSLGDSGQAQASLAFLGLSFLLQYNKKFFDWEGGLGSVQRKDRSWTGSELSFPGMFLKMQDNPWFQGYAGVMSPVGGCF